MLDVYEGGAVRSSRSDARQLARPATISATIERLLAQADDPNPAALYVESTPTPEHLPPFAAENPRLNAKEFVGEARFGYKLAVPYAYRTD